MNKKRLYMFLSVMFFISICILLVIIKAPKRIKTETIHVNKEDEINFFYYRCVSGLIRAESLELPTLIKKSYPIPNSDSELKIDRVWYNQKQITFFYHIENTNKISYLGGEIYLPGSDTSKAIICQGKECIGRASEKGVFYKDNFYSCVSFPTLLSENKEALDEVKTIYFKPYLEMRNPLHINGMNDKYSFEPFKIDINYSAEIEAIEKLQIDSSIKVENAQLKFYQIDLGSSYSRIYFALISNNRNEMLYHISGKLRTDKGEEITFNINPKIITDYPYHYYIELPALNYIPNSVILEIESIKLIGQEQALLEIPTKEYRKKKGRYALNKVVKTLCNTDITLKNLRMEDNRVWVDLNYYINKTKPNILLAREALNTKTSVEVLESIYGVKRPISNIITIYNENFQECIPTESTQGIINDSDNNISFCIPKNFWDESKEVLIYIDNLTYQINIEKQITITIEH